MQAAAALASAAVIIAVVANWRAISFTIENVISPPYAGDFYPKNFVVDEGVLYRLEAD